MSNSVKDLSVRFKFATVPLALILTSGISIWFGAIHSKTDFQSSPLRLPDFNYQAGTQKSITALPAPLPVKKIPSLTLEEPRRNIFGFTTVAKKEETNLEIMELALGLIVVKGKQRFCLTNGVMLAEGEAGNGFLIYRIEENRVWYKIGAALLNLHPGDKVSVDAEGNIRGVPDTVKSAGNENRDLQLNETQGIEPSL